MLKFSFQILRAGMRSIFNFRRTVARAARGWRHAHRFSPGLRRDLPRAPEAPADGAAIRRGSYEEDDEALPAPAAFVRERIFEDYIYMDWVEKKR